eukprot:Awhi_evm2s6537
MGILYAAEFNNPEVGGCNGTLFTEWSNNKTYVDEVSLQVEDCCFRTNVFVFNGPKQIVIDTWQSTDSYPTCIGNTFDEDGTVIVNRIPIKNNDTD